MGDDGACPAWAWGRDVLGLGDGGGDGPAEESAH